MNPKYRVIIVADRHFRQGLAGFPATEPIWIADTPHNRPIIDAAWKDKKDTNHLTGVTSYTTGESATQEDDVIELLPTIDEHHGVYSHSPAYDAVLIYGVSKSERLLEAFQGYGFSFHAESSESIEFRKQNHRDFRS